MREANERQHDSSLKRPHRDISDKDELIQYRISKRKSFEDEIRHQRHHLGTWMKYAEWEASQHEFQRARSVYERALDVDYQHIRYVRDGRLV